MTETTDDELTAIYNEANGCPEYHFIHFRREVFAAMRLAMEKAGEEQKEVDAEICHKRAQDEPGKLPTPDAYKDEALLCKAAIRNQP